MKECTSKVLLLAEMIGLMLPTTLFYLLFAPVFLFDSFTRTHDLLDMLYVAALLFCALAIVAAWISAVYFIRFGRAGLGRFPDRWKYIGYLGGTYVVLAWSMAALHQLHVIDKLSEGALWMIFGLYGSLLLVPLLHLSLEWSGTSAELENATRSNSRLTGVTVADKINRVRGNWYER